MNLEWRSGMVKKGNSGLWVNMKSIPLHTRSSGQWKSRFEIGELVVLDPCNVDVADITIWNAVNTNDVRPVVRSWRTRRCTMMKWYSTLWKEAFWRPQKRVRRALLLSYRCIRKRRAIRLEVCAGETGVWIKILCGAYYRKGSQENSPDD